MTNDVLVVTGGASGIGLACAEAMAADHSDVVLIDANEEGLETAKNTVGIAGSRVYAFQCDVRDADAQMQLADKTEREIGPVRTLVTCAGILNNSETVLDMDLAEHSRVWDVNYNGTVYSVRAFARSMTTRKRGAILTVGSTNSFAPLPLPDYGPSKTAILRLTEILAVELGRFGIRVNGIAPTYVITPAMQARIDSGDRDPDDIKKTGAIEMFVYPEDVASVAAFLCSDAASAMTGAMIPVDAGSKAAILYRSYAGGVPWADSD